MTDADLPAFMATFHRLRSIFPNRANPAEVEHIAGVYFGALRHHPLHVVEAAADKLIITEQYFPKPGQWLDAIPRQFVGVLEMTHADAREHQRAVALGYEDQPCSCRECVEAGVSHRFLRYVPDEDTDGGDVRRVLGGAVVARGHWAHGYELQRFYNAREVFWERYRQQIKALRSMPRVSRAAVQAEDDPVTA